MESYSLTRGNTIYFLTSFQERTYLKLSYNLIFRDYSKIWLNSTILNFYVENKRYPFFDIFEIEIVNTNIEKVLESAYKVLELFKYDLWELDFYDEPNEPNERIDIAYIKPAAKEGTFKIGIVSHYRLNHKLEMLAGISTPTAEFLKRVKEDFQNKTGLQINLKESVRKEVYNPPRQIFDKVKSIYCVLNYEINIY